MIFEFFFGKLIGKRIILAVEKKLKEKSLYFVKMASETIAFENMKDLETKLVKIS